jgi:hypothetical protein
MVPTQVPNGLKTTPSTACSAASRFSGRPSALCALPDGLLFRLACMSKKTVKNTVNLLRCRRIKLFDTFSFVLSFNQL